MMTGYRRLEYGAALVILGLWFSACIPKFTNFSNGATVPTTIATYVPKESHLLILPMWDDTRMHHFHSSYVIPTSAIGTPQGAVPPRKGMYLDAIDCGGPTTYVVGYLVVVDTGLVVWSDAKGENVSSDTRGLKSELKGLLTSGKLGPRLSELIQYHPNEVSLDLTHDERTIAMGLVDSIPDAEP